uniref:Putative secreted protein n=1 Tax=Anopheles marajoara TaxID=58244 RepID=A0A2M4C688_9DIPT
MVPVCHVPWLVFAHLVRSAERRSCGWCCDERPKRSVPGTSHVCPIPAVLRLLRLVRRHSNLSAMDHVPLLHPLRVRGYCPGHLLVRPRKAQVPPGVLSLQVAQHHAGGAGHVGRQLYARHRCPDHHLCRAAGGRVPVPALEAKDHQIKNDAPHQRVHGTRDGC